MSGSSDPPQEPEDAETRTAPTVAEGGGEPQVNLAAGTRVGAYVIGERLASGGFGSVYRAEHERLKRAAAIKVLHATWTSAPQMVRRFEREAQIVNRIRHPNIIDIFDFGELEGGCPYFVMELLFGSDVRGELKRRGAFSIEETVRILDAVSGALAAAHEQGVVHRDVKSSNVFLCDSSGRVVLLDFGIAKLADVTQLTSGRHAVGTPACMAPEQIAAGIVDARTDVYALGVLAYQMLVGKLPFAHSSDAMVRYMHLYARRPRASEHAAVPQAIDGVLQRAMSADPTGRQESARVFFSELASAASAG